MVSMTDAEFLEALKKNATGKRAEYKAFYSTFLGGITTSPHHMIVPIDDHMVHRGDAVFEAIKFVPQGIYSLGRHLDRLETSASNIDLKLPMSRTELEAKIVATVRASLQTEGLVRLFLARGPGGFTTNPYETTGSQIYCAITKLAPVPSEKYQTGVRVGVSSIAVKEGFFARTKTCNYLPNVLMKKEAVDRGLDFTVSLDESGAVAESSTENFAIISSSGALVVPMFDRILRGITMVRAMELAKKAGVSVEQRRIEISEIKTAKGALMLGTTLDALPVSSFEDKTWSEPLRQAPELVKLMQAFAFDISSGELLHRFA